MKTAIIIIAVCQVINTVSIVISVVNAIITHRQTMESINRVGDGVAEGLTPENMIKAIMKEVAGDDD